MQLYKTEQWFESQRTVDGGEDEKTGYKPAFYMRRGKNGHHAPMGKRKEDSARCLAEDTWCRGDETRRVLRKGGPVSCARD